MNLEAPGDKVNAGQRHWYRPLSTTCLLTSKICFPGTLCSFKPGFKVYPSLFDSLLELSSVRERCNKLADAQLTYWTVDESKLPDVTRYVLNLIQRDYNNDPTKIRPHGRWSHFLAAGTDRITPLLAAWTAEGADESEVCRRMIDLTVVSVLLDAGAGAWQYTEAQSDGSTTAIGRSEGLAVASLHMFQRGLFSSNQQYKHQVDADALKAISTDDVLQGLQISASNPMPGAEGRAGLLLRSVID